MDEGRFGHGESRITPARDDAPSRQERTFLYRREAFVRLGASVGSDISRLTDIVQLTLLGDAWENAEVGAVVFDTERRYLAANPAYCALTGYSREEITELQAGHNLHLDTMSQAEFIDRITHLDHVGQIEIIRKDGTPLPVSYLVVPTEVSELPYYIGLVWPQESSE
jgi:PAS domain S-box-containing protein